MNVLVSALHPPVQEYTIGVKDACSTCLFILPFLFLLVTSTFIQQELCLRMKEHTASVTSETAS